MRTLMQGAACAWSFQRLYHEVLNSPTSGSAVAQRVQATVKAAAAAPCGIGVVRRICNNCRGYRP